MELSTFLYIVSSPADFDISTTQCLGVTWITWVTYHVYGVTSNIYSITSGFLVAELMREICLPLLISWSVICYSQNYFFDEASSVGLITRGVFSTFICAHHSTVYLKKLTDITLKLFNLSTERLELLAATLILFIVSLAG